MKKRLLLVLTAMLTVIPAAWAADGDKFTATNSQGIEMTFQVTSEDEKTCQVGYYLDLGNGFAHSQTAVEYTTEGSVIIPSVVNTYTVTAINHNAFRGCTKITSVTIPETVTTIGEEAFCACKALTTISIPENVTVIKDHAFWESGLTSLTLPDGLTTIEEGAFSDCEDLRSINIPNGLTNIGGYLLSGCPNVTVYIDNCARKRFAEKVFSSYNGAGDTSISIIIENGVTTIGGSCFYDNDCITSVSIPNSITTIEGEDNWYFTEGAFSGCSRLASVSIPNSVTTIGRCAFQGCAITTLTIPGSVNTIEDYTFAYCKNLETVTIGEGVKSMYRAFCGCTNLKSISIPSTISQISSSGFEGCNSLETITIAAGNTVYDSRDNCNAIIRTATNTLEFGCKTTIIPQSVTTIGSQAFYYANLNSIVIPSGITNCSYNAFGNLQSISVESTNPVYDSRDNCNAIIETASNKIVIGCKNTVIPSSVSAIGEFAFSRCTDLTSISIPSNITDIQDGAFYECFNLADITLSSNITHLGNSIFTYTAWEENQPDGVMYVGEWAYGFKGNGDNITSLSIKEGTIGIADLAFGYNLYNLQSVTLPNSLKYIGNESFSDCSKLSTVKSLITNPFIIDNTVFSYTDPYTWTTVFTNATLYVPIGTKSQYESVAAWNQFTIIKEMEDISVTLSKDVVSFTADLPLDFVVPVAGLKAYAVSEVTDGKAVLTEVTGAVPAGTGLILKGTAGETYTIPYTTDTPAAISNKLIGVLNNTEIGGNDLDYVLSDGKFVKASAGTLSAGKAYLKLDAALARDVIEFDGVTTGISAKLMNRERVDNEVYNLQGQRVSTPAKGLYVINGKKVVKK